VPIIADVMPVLESGDHLTRAEFHRRYCARPDIQKAELVEGVVYVASPVSPRHAGPHSVINAWLSLYWFQHPELRLYDNVTVVLDADNEVQPDACLLREEPGGPRVDEAHHIEGAPQLIVEVAASSASYDLHEKLRVYRRNGVPEYIVWRVLDEQLDWFRLQDGEYVKIALDADGIIESAVFPGLRLAVSKLLAGDLAGVRAALEPERSGG
jgi:Uma2 family endonuclease